MATDVEIAWLAGLLEGEGCFGYYNSAPSIQLQMTDEDIVIRAATLMNAKMRSVWKPRGKPTYKPVYSCALRGPDCVAWMEAVLPFMGARRGAVIRDILHKWSLRTKPFRVRGQRNPAPCHPDRPVISKGMCKQCYHRDYILRTGKTTTHYRNKSLAA